MAESIFKPINPIMFSTAEIEEAAAYLVGDVLAALVTPMARQTDAIHAVRALADRQTKLTEKHRGLIARHVECYANIEMHQRSVARFSQAVIEANARFRNHPPGHDSGVSWEDQARHNDLLMRLYVATRNLLGRRRSAKLMEKKILKIERKVRNLIREAEELNEELTMLRELILGCMKDKPSASEIMRRAQEVKQGPRKSKMENRSSQ